MEEPSGASAKIPVSKPPLPVTTEDNLTDRENIYRIRSLLSIIPFHAHREKGVR